MTRHIGVQALALYREGQLSRRRSAKVAAHLSRCASCAKIHAELEAVPRVLGSLPQPAMPEHLAARIQMAIAAEAASWASAHASAVSDEGTAPGDVPAKPVARRGAGSTARHGGRHERPGIGRLLSRPVVLTVSAAAALVVAIGWGGYLVIAGGGSSPTAGKGAASASSEPRAAGPAVPPSFTLNYLQGGTRRTTQVRTSSANFRKATLAAQVRGEIGAAQVSSHARPAATSQHPPVGPARSASEANTAALAGCVSAVAAGRRVLLVELARYEGSPATIIITTGAPGSRTLVVIVVAGTCSAARAHIITRLVVPAS